MNFSFLPISASTMSTEVDHLLMFLVAVSAFFTILIFGAIAYFAVRYRRRSESEVPAPVHGGLTLEILWSVIPLGITMVMFTWGASVFFKINRAPDNALSINVVGKQWMWKIQHMEGQREINELHIPVGRPVKLTMTSEDVVHDFFVPNFRVKEDVVPGRYTTIWFQATQTGKFHLFCSQYCGTNHSAMIGWIYVMEPQDYEAWLRGGSGEGSLASRGQKLFQDLACANCHKTDSSGRCPNLTGLFGSNVRLSNGDVVKADENYIRESIAQPAAKIVAGYQPIMPTFQGLVSEEGMLELVEYVKSLGQPSGETQPPLGGETTPVLQSRPQGNQPSVGTSSPANR